MLWEVGSLAAATIVCDKDIHGKVLELREGTTLPHCPLLFKESMALGPWEILLLNGSVGLTA